MKIVTSQEMRDLENEAFKQGTSQNTLMENAGLGIARKARKLLGNLAPNNILVLVVTPFNETIWFEFSY